jgi:Protein of unknown function (DUF2934)
MKQASGSAGRTQAVIKRRSMELVTKSDSHAHPDGRESASRGERIQEAAYALYQARGCVNGHDLDDWFAAEAAVAREPNVALSALP